MNKVILVAALAIFLSGCTKTVIVSVPVMPTPPELLMRPPQELSTILDSSDDKEQEEPKDNNL